MFITLRAARVNRGMQLNEVASIVGESAETIKRFELDSSEIPRELVGFLLNLYHIHPDHLYFGLDADSTCKH